MIGPSGRNAVPSTARLEVSTVDEIWTAELENPFGNIAAAATGEGLVRIAFGHEDRTVFARQLAEIGVPRDDPQMLGPALAWLDAALTGGPTDPPPDYDPRLVRTPFARDVLTALSNVPAGTTMSYAELAAAAGHPRAVRAAAHVCATNPLPLVIGCHRIIRSDGTIGKYGGGAELKRHLLTCEAAATHPHNPTHRR
jgi:methylated-DNA-[protein]-cysteine S-methyltransferase